jgi:hypothetical protein
MGVFTNFQKMICPTVITVLYWIGIVVCILGGLWAFVASLATRDLGGAIVAILLIVLGPIAVRCYAELLIIIFRIYAVLVEIKNK